MTGKNYRKGRRKEYKLVNAARALGHIALRSAGSHSPIDVVIVNSKEKRIHLIQCKPENFAGKDRLMAQWGYISGTYEVAYEVL